MPRSGALVSLAAVEGRGRGLSEDLAGNRPREAPARKGRDVFISYSRHDKQVAEGVCAALEGAGISCWIGPRDTQAGAYGRSIMEAIHSARMLVLILSPEADKTPNVLTEVAEAFDSKLPLLPFRLSNFAASAEMRFYIRTQHWIDAFPEAVRDYLPALVARVEEVLRPGISPPPHVPLPTDKNANAPATTDPAPAAVHAGARWAKVSRPFGLNWRWAGFAILLVASAAAVAAVKPWTWFEGPGKAPSPPNPTSGVPPEQADAGQHCLAGDCWGAVAHGPNGAWAYAINYASRATAANAAEKRCRGRCTNVLTFHNSCGAYALGRGGYGWGNGQSKETAQQKAMSECRARAEQCVISVWGCTAR